MENKGNGKIYPRKEKKAENIGKDKICMVNVNRVENEGKTNYVLGKKRLEYEGKDKINVGRERGGKLEERQRIKTKGNHKINVVGKNGRKLE